MHSQEPQRKKQWSQRREKSGTSEVTLAQLPRASLSPIPPFGLVSFEGSEEDLPDDSMSLVAFDTEDWSCTLHVSAPQWIDSQSASLQHRSHHM